MWENVIFFGCVTTIDGHTYIWAMYSRRNLTLSRSIQSTHHVFFSQQKIVRQPICWKNLPPFQTGWAQKSSKKLHEFRVWENPAFRHGIHGGEGSLHQGSGVPFSWLSTPVSTGWHRPWRRFQRLASQSEYQHP